MITIRSMQILYRQATIFESFVTQKTKIKLIINGTKTYISSQSQIKLRLSNWGSDAFPLLQLPTISPTYNLQFVFFRNNEEVGKARCVILQGRNKKDCLDVANYKFNIIGKFLYQIIWNNVPSIYNINSNQNILVKQSYPLYSKQQSYQGYPNLNGYQPNITQYNPSYNQTQPNIIYYKAPNLNQPYFKNLAQYQTSPQTTQIKSQGQINKKAQRKKGNNPFQSLLGGCVGCVGGKRKKYHKINYFAIQPIVMDQNDLPYAQTAQNVEPFSIQYFSNRL